MKRFVLNSTVAAIALLTASSAFAGDYNSGVVTKTPSAGYTDVEFGSGWYLRGDITFNFRANSETTATSINSSVGSFNVEADYDDTIGVRAGAGYYVSPNFRIEGNVESILSSSFSGFRNQSYGGSREVVITSQVQPGTATTPPIFQDFPDTVFFDADGNVTGSNTGAYPTLIGNTAPGINGTEEIDAEYSATSFIISGYYDLPTLGKFTPYVGAGVGVGRINYNETRNLICTADASETCGFPAGQQGQVAELTLTRNSEFWALAYQLSAGASMQVTDRMKLDVGYSYTDFDGGDDISYDDGTAIDDDGFGVHQVRAGIRYDIW